MNPDKETTAVAKALDAFDIAFPEQPKQTEEQAERAYRNKSLLGRLCSNHPYLIAAILLFLCLNASFNVWKYNNLPQYAAITPAAMVAIYLLSLVMTLSFYTGLPLMLRGLFGQFSNAAAWGLVIGMCFCMITLMAAVSEPGEKTRHLSAMDMTFLLMAFRIVRLK